MKIKPIDKNEIQRVVVRGTNWVGDAVMSVPALRELRRVLPDARITLCTRSFARGIFADADFIDEILVYDRQPNATKSFLHQVGEWRRREFDLAVLFQNAFEAAVLAKLGRAKHRIGYNRDARALLLTHPLTVPTWKDERHEIFYYLNIVVNLETALTGGTTVWQREPRFELSVSPERQTQARKLLTRNGAELNRPIVALCPGSINSRAKRWGAKSYAELADLLYKELRANVVLIGSPDELDVSSEVIHAAAHKPILLTGKTDLAGVVAVLSVVDLLVTNDTGPAHIAPALGVPTLVIFGPTIPATTRPYSDIAEIIRKPPACAPCMLRDCPIDHRCMTAITPAEVSARAIKILTTDEHR